MHIPFKLKCNLAEHMLRLGISEGKLVICLAERGVTITGRYMLKICTSDMMPRLDLAYAIADFIGVPVTEIWVPYEWGGWNKGWEMKK